MNTINASNTPGDCCANRVSIHGWTARLARAGGALSLAACLLAGPAAGAPPASMTVRLGDLDLSTPAGSQALLHRVRAAALGVCRATSFGTGVDQQALYEACVSDTMKDAVGRLPDQRFADSAAVKVTSLGPDERTRRQPSPAPSTR